MSEEKNNLDAAAAVRELLARQKLVDELTDRPDAPRHEPDEETDAWAGTVPFTLDYGTPRRAEWSSAALPDSVRRLMAAGRG